MSLHRREGLTRAAEGGRLIAPSRFRQVGGDPILIRQRPGLLRAFHIRNEAGLQLTPIAKHAPALSDLRASPTSRRRRARSPTAGRHRRGVQGVQPAAHDRGVVPTHRPAPRRLRQLDVHTAPALVAALWVAEALAERGPEADTDSAGKSTDLRQPGRGKCRTPFPDQPQQRTSEGSRHPAPPSLGSRLPSVIAQSDNRTPDRAVIPGVQPAMDRMRGRSERQVWRKPPCR